MLSRHSGVAMVNRQVGTKPAMGELVEASNRYAAWFHELDGFTRYWDIYHPETNGRYHFGNGTTVLEVDRLVSRLFKKHFGDASAPSVQADYINAMLCFGCDTLPPATERAEQFSPSDPRKAAAARYAMENDLVWFSCALHLEAVHAIYGVDEDHARRSLMLAGIAVGCSADFVWRGHRPSRPEYSRDFQTAYFLRNLGVDWATDFRAASAEVHALFRIREWGREG